MPMPPMILFLCHFNKHINTTLWNNHALYSDFSEQKNHQNKENKSPSTMFEGQDNKNQAEQWEVQKGYLISFLEMQEGG